jgi:hypothetical protein
VPDAQDQDEHSFVLDARDDPVVADTVLPELAEPFDACPRERGSSEVTIRCRRNVRMRRATCRSSRSSSLRAAASNSSLQTKRALQYVQRSGRTLAGYQRCVASLGQVDVLQIVEMFKDGFARVIRLRAAGLASEFFQPSFDFGGQADGKHPGLQLLYKFSSRV